MVRGYLGYVEGRRRVEMERKNSSGFLAFLVFYLLPKSSSEEDEHLQFLVGIPRESFSSMLLRQWFRV